MNSTSCGSVPGVAQRGAHRARGAGAVARRRGHVHGVARQPAARHLDVRRRAAGARMGRRLHHQHRRTLADGQPVAARVERPHRRRGGRAQAVEARDDEVADGLGAADDEHVSLTALNELQRQADGVRPRRAGDRRAHHRSAHAERPRQARGRIRVRHVQELPRVEGGPVVPAAQIHLAEQHAAQRRRRDHPGAAGGRPLARSRPASRSASRAAASAYWLIRSRRWVSSPLRCCAGTKSGTSQASVWVKPLVSKLRIGPSALRPARDPARTRQRRSRAARWRRNR